jgi:hypothetical protein
LIHHMLNPHCKQKHRQEVPDAAAANRIGVVHLGVSLLQHDLLVDVGVQAQLVKTMGTQVTEQLQGFWQTATPLPAALQQQLALLQHGSPQQQQQQQQPRVAVLITALLLQHLPLTARELKEWEDDAEAFYHAADTTSSWQDSPRGCAEQLVLVLVVSRAEVGGCLLVSHTTPPAMGTSCLSRPTAPFLQLYSKSRENALSPQAGLMDQPDMRRCAGVCSRLMSAMGSACLGCSTPVQVKMEALVPLLVQYLAAAASSCPPGAAPAALPGPRVGPGQVPRLLLLKEALYRAAATSSFQLAPAVDYSSWLKSSLVQVRRCGRV